MPKIDLFPRQIEAIEMLRSGSILCSGTGAGKSITALAYYYIKECGGSIAQDGCLVSRTRPKDLYIITTARKRDTKEWEDELSKLGLISSEESKIVIDSWNNIKKYSVDVKNAFYIFDEQRVVGSGSWVKSFLKIAKCNNWILLSATPGDTWSDYIPVFVANGFYKNKTEFLNRHAVYSRYTKYPKSDNYLECGHLEYLRRKITVVMDYKKPTVSHFVNIPVQYDNLLFKKTYAGRWNPYEERPIENGGELCYLVRRVTNSDPSRIQAVRKLMNEHARLIIFYNFDYELEALRSLRSERALSEWNGHNHEPIPEADSWIFLVQYMAGAEGWNCISTNAMIFYSQNYSYKLTTQAAGRIDRLNTPYSDLYYYTLKSSSPIDVMISRSLKNKRNFNENDFLKGVKLA